MLLLLDVGNSRLKWALVSGGQWITRGAVAKQDIGALALGQWQNLPRPKAAIGVNVAGEAVRVRVEGQLARWRLRPRWFTATESQCGVRNAYQEPAQLGSDRWAAVVGAWQREHARCIVVNAGTALTIDALDGEEGKGVFRGGLIVPGLRIMRQSLAQNTAALKLLPGEFEAMPTSTANAMWTGAIHAACGSIERLRATLAGGQELPRCLISGGGAAELAPHLNAPIAVIDNLVLEGVLAMATALPLA
jgi:type III pantothenate kinase